MANFIIICDPYVQRRNQFMEAIKPVMPPVDGLTVSTCSTGNCSAIWAAYEKAPISYVTDERGGAVVWGDALSGTRRINAEHLRDIWKVEPGYVFDAFDGYHAAVVFQPHGGLVVGADILGLFPVYYYASGDTIIVGSSPELFQYHPLFRTELNPAGFVGLLLTNGLFNNETLLRGVRRLGAGHVLVWRPGMPPEEMLQYSIPITTMYFDLSFSGQVSLIDRTFSEAVSRHLSGDKQTGLLLSGGLDSRTMGGYLKEKGIATVALTLGAPTDIEMKCASEVAKTLDVEHHAVPILFSPYPMYAGLQNIWEHCANGFNNIWGWGIYPHVRKLPRRIASGFLMDVILGGAYPKSHDVPVTFETIFSQVNAWGLAPEVLSKLLKKDVFNDSVQETIDQLRTVYESYAEDETRRTLCFKLSHRQRFHVGGVAWQISFGAWPVLPAVDRAVLEVVGGMPAAALSERRAQKELLCRKFQKLAAIPLDTNSYQTELLQPRLRHMLVKYLRDRAAPLSKIVKQVKRRNNIERRHYYRLYDYNGPGWRAVRREAEKSRNATADFFNMDVFNKLLPDPDTAVSFNDGIVDASGLKILIGLLLWAGRRSFTHSHEQAVKL